MPRLAGIDGEWKSHKILPFSVGSSSRKCTSLTQNQRQRRARGEPYAEPKPC